MAKATRPLPPLDLLRGFEAAARHLSFTRAGEELFLTQSAVSRQIQALEEFLGVPLFERRHKALALTEAGQAYFRAVTSALGEVREATRRLRESRAGPVLTVTTTISFASTWLIPRLARFRREQPRVDVRIAASPLLVDLEREGVDVAVRDLPLDRVPAGAIKLVGEHLGAVCSPAYARESRAAGRPLARPEDLRHHVLIHYNDPGGRWPWLTWAAWLEARHVEELVPAGGLIFDQYDQVIQAALHGQGVALGRISLVQQFVRSGELRVLFGKAQKVARGYHALAARGTEGRPEVAQFIEWLRRELGAEDAAS